MAGCRCEAESPTEKTCLKEHVSVSAFLSYPTGPTATFARNSNGFLHVEWPDEVLYVHVSKSFLEDLVDERNKYLQLLKQVRRDVQINLGDLN